MIIIIGLQADEIHLCGEASTIPLIKSICASINEEVIICEYERLTPLTVLNQSLKGSLTNIRPGDCVVTFSRANIFAFKKQIESVTGLRCAVIYGSLPSETRSEQARLFNQVNSGYDVLVASDAIGMGLNLNIKRIVFERMEKYDGNFTTPLSISQVKQIAGRAGRFLTNNPMGEATTFESSDLRYLHRCMDQDIPDLETAGLAPNMEQLEAFHRALPNEHLSSLLTKFEDLSRISGDYQLCDLDDLKLIADLTQPLKMPLRDQYQFVTSPVNARRERMTNALWIMAKSHCDKRPLFVSELVELPKEAPKIAAELRELEYTHRIIMNYIWLR